MKKPKYKIGDCVVVKTAINRLTMFQVKSAYSDALGMGWCYVFGGIDGAGYTCREEDVILKVE